MKTVSLQSLFKHLPPDVHLREDGTVVHIDEAEMASVVPILYNSNGKPFVDFKHETGTIFTVWLSREFFRAFRGLIPEGFEAYHVDGNRANLKPANLELRPRSKAKSKFKLATIPRGGLPPAA